MRVAGPRRALSWAVVSSYHPLSIRPIMAGKGQEEGARSYLFGSSGLRAKLQSLCACVGGTVPPSPLTVLEASL